MIPDREARIILALLLCGCAVALYFLWLGWEMTK